MLCLHAGLFEIQYCVFTTTADIGKWNVQHCVCMLVCLKFNIVFSQRTANIGK